MHLSEGKVISGSRVMSAGKEGTETFRLKAEMLVNLFNARGREEVRLWKTNC